MNTQNSKIDTEEAVISGELNTLAEAIKEVVKDLFRNCGSAEIIEDILWRMFEGAISNTALPTDELENGQFAYTYRRLKETLESLETVLKESEKQLRPKTESKAAA